MGLLCPAKIRVVWASAQWDGGERCVEVWEARPTGLVSYVAGDRSNKLSSLSQGKWES
jgi:hypothetical protein